MPLPATLSVWVAFAALLLKEMVPEAVPLVCGVNTMLKEALWPALNVSGNAIPLSANSELLEVAEETVTLDPLALNEAGWVELVPTLTLPKFKVVGDSVSCPGLVPLPESGMLRFGLEALESSDRVPLALPLTVGAKATLNVTLCPGVKLCGTFNPLRLNPEPVTLACEIVTLAVLGLLNVTDCV